MTDELDRRVLSSYLNKFYCEDALNVPQYLLSPLPTYYIPDNGPLQSFKVCSAWVGGVHAQEPYVMCWLACGSWGCDGLLRVGMHCIWVGPTALQRGGSILH